MPPTREAIVHIDRALFLHTPHISNATVSFRNTSTKLTHSTARTAFSCLIDSVYGGRTCRDDVTESVT